MTRLALVGELERTAERIADASRADLQVMLRRAALMLRNVNGVALDPKVDEPTTSLAHEMGVSKPDLINTIVGEWLIANAYLPVATLEEDSEIGGSA